MAATLTLAASLRAATPQKQEPPDLVHEFSTSVQALADKVSPSVVQILVTGFGPLEERESGEAGLVVGRQHSIGSGVIVDPEGYIMTNAHVVAGAQRIRVALSPLSPGLSLLRPTATSHTRIIDATLVGEFKEGDLALVKINASGLTALPFGDYNQVRQGQLVFAFGSPEGLRNSMTMGVVSSVARQPDPDSPIVYIQTDAPINPGNSGGPLVDVDGNIVGISTFILTQSGGSQGLGFAIPSGAIRMVYEQLRKFGHMHRAEIGAGLQTITPTLAAGLGLPLDWGVIVSDVLPGGPASAAGLKIGDILLSLDGKPATSLPTFAQYLYLHSGGDIANLEVLRGSDKVRLDIHVIQKSHGVDRLTDLANPAKNLIPKLGVICIEITPQLLEMAGDIRIRSGAAVAARAATPAGGETGLVTGDVIHALNGRSVKGLEDLRALSNGLKAGDAVVLQIERDGRLMYAAFELE